jgi:uncharacterized OB-fold protein
MSKPARPVSRGNDGTASAGVRSIAPQPYRKDPDGRVRLIGGKCPACGALSFLGAIVCTECLSEAVTPHALADRGRLYSYSVVHNAPSGWNVPYVLG